MAATKRNTCPLCGDKRDGRNLARQCPRCGNDHATAARLCQKSLATNAVPDEFVDPICRMANEVWRAIADDIMRAVAEDDPNATIDRDTVIEVVCDADRLRERLRMHGYREAAAYVGRVENFDRVDALLRERVFIHKEYA